MDVPCLCLLRRSSSPCLTATSLWTMWFVMASGIPMVPLLPATWITRMGVSDVLPWLVPLLLHRLRARPPRRGGSAPCKSSLLRAWIGPSVGDLFSLCQCPFRGGVPSVDLLRTKSSAPCLHRPPFFRLVIFICLVACLHHVLCGYPAKEGITIKL